MGGVLRGRGEKVKSKRSTNWQLQNSHEEVQYSIGNTVSNIVITMVPDLYENYWGDHFVTFVNI